MVQQPLNVAYSDGSSQVLWEDGERVFSRGWRQDDNGNRIAVLLVAPAADQRNFHAPGRDTDTAGADGSHLRAERVLHSEGDHGPVHEHDNILRRALWSRRGGVSIVSLICMSGLLACDRSTERRLRPVHEGGRRWVAD